MSETDRPDDGTVTCAECGRQAEAATAWTWSTGTDERGRTSTVCPDCVRTHARSIEAKLDDDWW